MRNLAAFLLLLSAVPGLAQQADAAHRGTIFVVRHAEKESESADALSAQGKVRAACLASTLKDAKITTVLSSPYQRTQQTATPTADEFKLQVKALKADDYTAISNEAREASKSGDVLIVGHSNTVPQIVKAIGNSEVKIGNSDYDWLFVIDSSGTTQLHYCPTTAPEPESRIK